MGIRKTVVSGSFYPDDKKELESLINGFSKEISSDKKLEEVRAIIVPHAGYIYSGKTANLAYFNVTNKNPKRVILIGPSHHVHLEGASICLDDSYETPLGNINIDVELSKHLLPKYDFLNTNDECAFEHSTETQAPFVKHYFPNTKLLEIVYGDIDFNELSILIDELLEDEDNLIVISTDLSHFYSLEDASKLDNICIKAIETSNIKMIDSCKACGKTGIQSVIKSANKKSYKAKVLDYSTSHDVTKDKTKVVGYTSALIGN